MDFLWRRNGIKIWLWCVWSRDSRVADVDPRVNLVEVFGGPAVEAAVVRQQVVELLQGNLEAGHVEAVRERRLSAPLLFAPHVRRGVPQDLQQAHLAGGEAADRCRLTGLEAAVSCVSTTG